MENRDPTQNQGGEGQGGKRKPGGGRKGGGQKRGENDRGREDQDGSRQGVPASPSGVPNEGRVRVDGEDRPDKAGREVQDNYKYKGGRQSTGGIPNPDDQDDSQSAGTFRRTAEQDAGTDDNDGEQTLDEHDGGINRNSRSRLPNTGPNQRGAESSKDKTRNPA